MEINTKMLGLVEFKEDDIIDFPDGIYGFEDKTKFILVENPEKEMPFDWLQSLDDENLSFIITNPFNFVEKYEFELDDEHVERLKVKEADDIVVVSITVVSKEVVNTTINLKAPIVINKKEKIGKQCILKKDYATKYKIFNKDGE